MKDVKSPREPCDSPEIKIVNKANSSIDVNILVGISPGSSGNEDDVTLSLTNEFMNQTLTNPVTVPTSDLKIRVKHDFKANANLGSYTFNLSIAPA